MANKKLINSISNFASALEQLVDELKEQEKAKKENTNIFSRIFGKDSISKTMKRVEEGIKDIKADTKEIIRNQRELLKLNKAKKKEENKNIIGDAGDKTMIDKIKKGVGSIILIAGAVLAIGMAFKLVGKVDFVSVMALSLSITIIGHTLARLADSKIPSVDESLLIGFSLLAFTSAIVTSSWLLKLTAPVSVSQLITAGLIAATFSVLSLGMKSLVSSVEGIKPTQVLYLPLVLVGISLAVMASSHILQHTQPISGALLFNILLMGLTLGAIAIVMSLPILLLSKLGTNAIIGSLVAIVALPAISLAIMLSSHLLAMGDYSNPLPISWAISFSLSMLVLAVPVTLLGLATLPVVAMGSAGLVLVAGAITLASHILAKSDPRGFEVIADSIAYFINVVTEPINRFVSKVLPTLAKGIGLMYKSVLIPLRKFIGGILPLVKDFVKTVLDGVFPYVEKILDFAKHIISSLGDIFDGIGKMIERASSIFPKIGRMFKLIGEGIATPLKVFGSVIESFGHTVVTIITSIVDSVDRFSKMDHRNLLKVGKSLSIIGSSIKDLTGGVSDTLLNWVTGGKIDPVTRILRSITKEGNNLSEVTVSLERLLNNIDRLSDVKIDRQGTDRILNILDRIDRMKSISGKVETVSRTLVGIDGIKDTISAENEELIAQVRLTNQLLYVLANNSSIISTKLNSLRNRDEGSELSFNN